jgi:hypothetical protein
MATVVTASQVRSADIAPCLDLWNRTAAPDGRGLMATAEGDVQVFASLVTWTDSVEWSCDLSLVTADGQRFVFTGDESAEDGRGWLQVPGGPSVDQKDTMPPGTARAQADGTLAAT